MSLEKNVSEYEDIANTPEYKREVAIKEIMIKAKTENLDVVLTIAACQAWDNFEENKGLDPFEDIDVVYSNKVISTSGKLRGLYGQLNIEATKKHWSGDKSVDPEQAKLDHEQYLKTWASLLKYRDEVNESNKK